jgi:hypothetical protein
MYRFRNLLFALAALLFMVAGLAACDTGGPQAQPTPTAEIAEPTSEPTEEATRAPTRSSGRTPTSGNTGAGFNYSSTDGGFRARFPNRPAENRQTNTTAELGEIEVFSVESKAGGSTYTIVYLDYPDIVVQTADPEVLVQNVFKEVVKENTIVDQQVTTSDGYPALVGEYEIGTTGYARYKAVLAGNRIYQVIAITPDENRNKETATGFISSFRLLEPAGRVTPTRGTRATPTTAGGTDTPAGWVTYTSDEGQFSVVMPTNPREGTQQRTANGVELNLFTFVSSGGGAEYTIVYVDYAEEIVAGQDPRQLLANAFSGVHGTNPVATQQEVDVQGNPGFYAEFESTSGYAWYKSILRDTRLYQLIVIAPNREAAADEADAFLNSFEITGGGGTGVATASRVENTPVSVEPTAGGSTGEMSGITGLNKTLRFTINSIRHDDGASEILKPDEGNEYVYLDITIENTGDREESVSTAFAGIQDSESFQHGATYGPHVKNILNGSVTAGGKLRGTMGFEVPKSATGLHFIYDPPLDGNTLRIKLDR